MIRDDTQPERASTLPQRVVITAANARYVPERPDESDKLEKEREMKWGRVTKRKWQTRGSERDTVSKGEREREGRRVILPNKQRRGRDVCWTEEKLRKKGEAVPVSCIIYCMLSYLCEAPVVEVQLWIERGGWWGRKSQGRSCFLPGRRQDVNT